MKLSDLKTVDQVIAERRADPDFAAGWDRTAFARRVALAVVRYRAERGMTQQALADATGLKQSAIARLEVGETPPALLTLAKLTLATGLEFTLDIANGDVAMPEHAPSDTVMSEFRFQWSLLVVCRTGEQLTAEELSSQADQLLGELVKLERCNPSMADPDTSFDAAEGSVTAEMDIVAADEPEAARLALQICRSAIHAIGGGTAEWPSEPDADRGADFRPHRMGFAYS